jgi:hypothetical protein
MKVPAPNSTPARHASLAVLAAVLVLTGCDNPFDRTQPLPLEPTSASLADFREGGIGEATAFQLNNGRTVLPSQTSDWDFVFWVDDGGRPQFRPRDMITDGSSDAGLAPVEASFEGLEEAPEEGYRTKEPVPADSGAVYAVRSRQAPGLGLQCRRYAKIEVTSVNAEAGTVSFRHLVNPNCEQRNLVPGSGGER